MTADPAPPEVLRRAAGVAGGEVVLRVRGDVHELVVDGVFAMDTVDTSTERLLASAALARLDGTGLHVVVGGLGLGFTLRALLGEARVARVDVVELEPALVEWLRDGVVPGAERALADPRVRVHAGDVREVVPTLPPGAVDAVLLDVDNGLSFLVHGANASVYEERFLRTCLDRLRPGGVLAVWSSDAEPALHTRLAALAGGCEEQELTVEREGRTFAYALYVARAAAATSAPSARRAP
ncbi:MAG: hypothetical protein GEV10_03400 [Streptosporangiales bacterium]|nr:hypothetical protein [Streptosporangiales bacterium]